MEELQKILSGAEEQQRALDETEDKRFKELEAEIEKIDSTIAAKERASKLKIEENPAGKPEEKEVKERAANEEKQFELFVRGMITQERADNMTFGDNGAVIPYTIANKIIQEVHDICPVFARATRYNIKGTLAIPYYPADASNITMAYADEFVELTSTAGKFASIELKGFLAGVLTLVSRSLINNSQFNIVSFVVREMAYQISRWIENELLHGTTGKMEGLSGVTQTVTAAATDAITMDELISLKYTIKDVFQPNSIWIMSPSTRESIRKLKDGNGRYFLQDDLTSAFGQVLLGKPVFVSDNMPDMATGETAIYYGDLTGLAVKMVDAMEISILREHFATQHALGVNAWMEMDSKVENAQKLVKLVMA